MSKPQRGSNRIYILAAVGCAAGLGNLWRFPMLAYEFGGAAFIIALLLSNLVIVFPLVMSETMIGQKLRLSGPAAFQKIKHGRAWVQRLPVFVLSFILMYYTPIMAWAMKYFVSLRGNDWASDTTIFFTDNIIALSPDISTNMGRDIGLVVALVIAFIVIGISLRRSIQSLSAVLKFTAVAPFVLLLILLVRTVTLDGATLGLDALFIPDRSQLLNLEMRNAAIGQSFFSASLAFGYFIVSGSHRPAKSEVPRSTLWILGGNFLVSLLSGVVVFATLGFMAQTQGVNLEDLAVGGPMLVFTVLPEAIAQMPFVSNIFLGMLMLVVVTLAIDSVFGIVETIVGAFSDRVNVSYQRLLIIVLSIAFLGGLAFTSQAGMYYLDITDHYVGSFMLLLIGFLELGVILFFLGSKKMRQWINETTKKKLGRWFDVLLWMSFVIVGGVLATALYRERDGLYGGYPLLYIILFGFLPLLIVVGASLILGRQQKTIS